MQIGNEDTHTSGEISLADGERILGVKSSLFLESNQQHLNLTLVIGWLEE